MYEFNTPTNVTSTLYNPELRLKGGERLITLKKKQVPGSVSWFAGRVQIYSYFFEVWLAYNVEQYKWLIRPKKYYNEEVWEFLFGLKPGEIPKDTIVAINRDANGNIVLGDQSALATTATDGFNYVRGGAGAPTGTPATSITGHVPMYADTTNNKLYIYSGGAWVALN